MSCISALRMYPAASIEEPKPLSDLGSASAAISKVLRRIKDPKEIAYRFLGAYQFVEGDIFQRKPKAQRILVHCYQENPSTATNELAKMDTLDQKIKILLKEHNTKQRPPNPIIRGDFVFQLNMSEQESLISFVENRGAPMSYIFNQICNELLQDLTKFGLRYERYTDLMCAETQQVRVACLPDLQPQAIEMFEIMPLDNTKEYGLTLDRRTGQLEIRVPITSIAAPSAS